MSMIEVLAILGTILSVFGFALCAYGFWLSKKSSESK